MVHRDEGVFDVPRAGMEAALALVGYYADLMAQRRAQPQSDLTSALVNAEIDGDRLSDDEVIGFLFLMVVAGNETTTKLLANAVYWGWRYPGELAKPLADPARVADWVTRRCRFDASTQFIARTVAEDFSAYGQKVSAGDRLLLLIGSANRDPRRLRRPRPLRPGPRHLGADQLRRGPALLPGRQTWPGWRRRSRSASSSAEFSALRDRRGRARRVHSVNVRGFAALPMRLEAR